MLSIIDEFELVKLLIIYNNLILLVFIIQRSILLALINLYRREFFHSQSCSEFENISKGRDLLRLILAPILQNSSQYLFYSLLFAILRDFLIVMYLTIPQFIRDVSEDSLFCIIIKHYQYLRVLLPYTSGELINFKEHRYVYIELTILRKAVIEL